MRQTSASTSVLCKSIGPLFLFAMMNGCLAPTVRVADDELQRTPVGRYIAEHLFYESDADIASGVAAMLNGHSQPPPNSVAEYQSAARAIGMTCPTHSVRPLKCVYLRAVEVSPATMVLGTGLVWADEPPKLFQIHLKLLFQSSEGMSPSVYFVSKGVTR